MCVCKSICGTWVLGLLWITYYAHAIQARGRLCVCVCMPYASAALITVALVIRPVVDVLVA